MSRQLISNWFSKLGEPQKDLPLLLVNGIAYTPRAAYTEVINGTIIGTQLQALVETGRFGTSTLDEIAIAKARIRQSLQSKPQDKPLFATLPSGKLFTPADILEEIESGTPFGQQYLNGEIAQMRNLVAIR
jgi:hypothetical protein